MFLLRLENAHLGDDEVLDRFQYITATADPAGTHVETYYPVKWFYEGEGAHTARDVADIPTRTLVNEAAVIDVPDLERPMGPGDLKRAAKHLKPGDNVMFRSGLNRRWEDPGINPGGLESAYDQRTGLTLPATQWLTDQKVRACAIDFRTPEDPEYKWELPSHKQLHVNDVLIIEDIAHLDRLSSERLLMITGAPIKGRHLTGGPARIVGIEGWGGPSTKVVDLSHVMGRYPAAVPDTRSRAALPQDEYEVLNRADFLFFDIGMTGLSDLVGPQYMRVSSRAGTHLVNAYHDGTPLFEDVAAIKADRLVGPANLIDVTHVGAGRTVRPADLSSGIDRLRPGDWAVLRSDHADWYQSRAGAIDASPRLSIEAVQALAERHIRGIISDLTAISPLAERRDLEQALNELGLLFVAGARRLWLSRRERCLAAVLPLPIRGLVHSPVQVFLIEDWADDAWLSDRQFEPH